MMKFRTQPSKSFILTMTIVFSLSLLVIAQSRSIRKPAIQKSSPAPAGNPAATQQISAIRNLQSVIPLRRVILYSNGVAYFERRGTVTGNTEINLSFKQSQVDDVLKSLVVLDLGRGRVGAVSYNSSAPPSARLNEIPFSIESATGDDATGGLAGVLRQLQGARIAITAVNRNLTGAIITIGERTIPSEKDRPPVKTHTLVISTESGELQSVDLTEVRSVKLLDEGAKQDISQFADASASARRRDAKTITVTSEGEGQREMVISYTVSAPIWKTTYRVVLDNAGKPFFQGWAVIDNVSEEDWQDVSLSLVSGTPVSFIHQIQKPLYRYRPIVPIPQDLNLNPQVYESEQSAVSDSVGRPASGSGTIGRLSGRLDEAKSLKKDERRTSTIPMPQQQVQNLPLNSRNFNNSLSLTPGTNPPAPPEISTAITSGESGIEAAATGNEVGELFEYRVEQPVTVKRDRSALIPILQTQMEGERVAVYNEAVRRDRPMHGIRLKNTSNLTLEGGSLSVIDGDAYAGEALIERLKPNEQRFISFGLDLGTLITTKFKTERRPVFLVRAQNGVFETHYYQTQKKTYTIINQTDKKRIIYIEHPRNDAWKLSEDTQKPASQTINFYRFRIELEPRTTIELPVIETQSLLDRYQLSAITRREIELFVSSNYLTLELRAELEKLVELKRKISAVQSKIESLDHEAQEISEDQKRLRDNIATLKNTNEAKQLVARYIAKAGEQETRLEQIAKEKRATQDELSKLSAELDAAMRALSIERKL